MSESRRSPRVFPRHTPTGPIARRRFPDAAPNSNIVVLMQAMSQLQSILTTHSNSLTNELNSRFQSMFVAQPSAFTTRLNSQSGAVSSITSLLNQIKQSKQRSHSQQSHQSQPALQPLQSQQPQQVGASLLTPYTQQSAVAFASQLSTTISVIVRNTSSDPCQIAPVNAVLDPRVRYVLLPN